MMDKQKTPQYYWVVDRQTGRVVSTHSTLKLAHRKADKLDLEYGAVRYNVKYTGPREAQS